MTAITFDPARKLTLYIRIGSDGSKTINFYNSAGAGYDISALTFNLYIYERVGSSAYATWTEATELSKPDNYSLTITHTDTASAAFRPGQYYYRLTRTDGSGLIKTWLNGPFIAHNGEFNGIDETTTLTIDESGTAISLTVSDTASPIAASQSETNAGTATGVYVSPATLNDLDNDVVALVDGATIDLTGPKHTLATATGRTFTISHAGDVIVLEITLSATSATFTFPATALCSYGGTASGDNTLPVTGATSGDLISIAILKVGSNYRVAAVNFGQ